MPAPHQPHQQDQNQKRHHISGKCFCRGGWCFKLLVLLLILLLLLLQEDRGGGPRRAQDQISGKLGLACLILAGGGPQFIPMLGLSVEVLRPNAIAMTSCHHISVITWTWTFWERDNLDVLVMPGRASVRNGGVMICALC